MSSRITPSTIWDLMIEGHDTNENQSIINDWVISDSPSNSDSDIRETGEIR